MKYYKQSSLSHRIASGKLDKRKVLRWLQKISHHLLKSHARLHPMIKNNSQRKIHLKRHLPLTVLSLSLTGCMGIYEGGFECPAGTGVGCKSISEVNTMVNRNQLPGIRNQEIETGDRVLTCSACGCSTGPPQERPDIWINPLYLKELHEEHQEKPRDNDKEKSQEIHQQKVLDDTISL